MNDRAPGVAAADLVSRLVRPEIRALSAYPIAKAEGMVKLDVNASEVEDLAKKGTQQKRRGRKPREQ